MLKVVILGAEEATAVTSIHKCFNDLVQMTRTSLLRLINNFIKKKTSADSDSVKSSDDDQKAKCS